MSRNLFWIMHYSSLRMGKNIILSVFFSFSVLAVPLLRTAPQLRYSTQLKLVWMALIQPDTEIQLLIPHVSRLAGNELRNTSSIAQCVGTP